MSHFSNHLGKKRMPTNPVRSVSLFSLAHRFTYEDKAQMLLADCANWLVHFFHKKGVDVYAEPSLHSMLDAQALKKSQAVDLSMLSKKGEALVSIGGDGSMLQCAKLSMGHDVPIMGINLGKLGFLTSLHDAQKLEEPLSLMLDGALNVRIQYPLRVESPEQTLHAVNEATVRALDGGIVRWRIFCEGEIIIEQDSDGLIFSTTSGSTAHALSAGGPIMHPDLDALSIVPICPHKLTSRPLVLPLDWALEVEVDAQSRHSGAWFCDGRQGGVLDPLGSKLSIAQSSQSVHWLEFPDYSFFRLCREKLGWELDSFS